MLGRQPMGYSRWGTLQQVVLSEKRKSEFPLLRVPWQVSLFFSVLALILTFDYSEIKF